jgi:hypothetical protein
MTETTEGPLAAAIPARGRQHEGQQPEHQQAEHRFASMHQLFAIPKSNRFKRDATG